jgi:peptidoglycan/LPS O-acetylase OafA/YrhL
MPHAQRPALQHIPALDGLRGIAVGSVVAFHIVVEFAPGGAVGVDIFFALSSFLITSLIWREMETAGGMSCRNFYWRRACRLLPALVLLVAVIAPITVFAVGQEDQVWTGTWLSLTYLADFAIVGIGGLPHVDPVYAHTWSLAVEEHFYIIWPVFAVAMYRTRPRRRATMVAFMVSLAVASLAISDAEFGIARTYFFATGHLVPLAAGVVAAWVVRFGSAGRCAAYLRNQEGAWLGWAGLTILVALVVLPITWPIVGWGLTRSLATAGATGVILVQLSSGRSRLSALLSNRLLVWAGRRSYGIYLYHGALVHCFVSTVLPLSRSASALLGVGVGLLTAELSYRWVESPILTWGRRHSRRAVQTARDHDIRIDASGALTSAAPAMGIGAEAR